MKDGSQAAVRACKCPPSAPARDMERDNTPMWAHWAPGDHHQWRASTSSPSIYPSLCSFFAIFAIFSTMCAMVLWWIAVVWAVPLGPNMTHLSQLPRPRVEPKPGHERGRGVGGDQPNCGGLASLFLARVKSSRNWLCSWSLVDNCNVITW